MCNFYKTYSTVQACKFQVIDALVLINCNCMANVPNLIAWDCSLRLREATKEREPPNVLEERLNNKTLAML